MKRSTGIEWTDRVWNPTRGCSPVSPGCANCFAARCASQRLSGPGRPYEGLVTSTGKWTGEVRFATDKLDEPLHWREPCRVFVDSMSDLFHPGFTNEQIAAVFGAMAACQRHTFQVLTKRPDRAHEWFEWLRKLAEDLNRADDFVVQQAAYDLLDDEFPLELDTFRVFPWPLPNVHLLVSCEDQKRADERIPLLLQCPAAVHGVSLEPLLGPINLCAVPDDKCRVAEFSARASIAADLSWVIVGGESGPRRRRCELEWAIDIARQCREAGVPFFGKQFDIAGKVSKNPDEWPPDLRVRMYPGERWSA